jgi:hypothetical protein
MEFGDHEDTERDYSADMIHWLADKNPDVWFAATQRLNWDNAIPVLEWIVSQPNCDKANAAMIFWLADPVYDSEQLVKGAQPDTETWPLVQTILRNWRTGFYHRRELAWPNGTDMPEIDHYLQRLAAVPGGQTALDLPADLMRPLSGRASRLAPADQPEENPEVWDLFWGLGTWCGPRPHGKEWLAARDDQAMADKKRKSEIPLGMFFIAVAAAFAVLAWYLSRLRS